MVEIALLLAGAETAVSTIKKAISVGKQAHDCLGEFMKFFDAQDAINKASMQDRHKAGSDQSAMSEAMQSVVAAKKMKEMMADLQRYLVWETGQPEVWNDIIRERNAVVARRKAAELEAEKAAKRKQKEREELIEICVVTAASVALAAMVIWGVYLVVNYLYH